MVKKEGKSILSIVENLRRVVRENDENVNKEIDKIKKMTKSLLLEKNKFANTVESLIADVESFAGNAIAEERVKDEEIVEFAFFSTDDENAEGDRQRMTREGRAAISFLVAKFDDICESIGLDVEIEGLRDVRDLRDRGALTDDSCRLKQIDDAFRKLKRAYDRLCSIWLSKSLADCFNDLTEDVVDEETVIDIETFVGDQLLDVVDSPVIGDVLLLDTHDKTREFAKYLDAIKDV
jgi:hypothetical protein